MNKHTAEMLEQHFDTAFAAPGGIAKLRELILTLAMQGKLVDQDPNDPPASELLKEIEAQKQRLVKAGTIKKLKPLPPIKPEEVPYELPQGWEWVRLGEITSKITDGDHKTPPRISEGHRLLSAKNVRDGCLDLEHCDFISEQHYQKSRERCLPEMGDLLIVSVGGTIGRSSLVPQDSDFALVRSVALIKPLLLNSKYLKYAMDSQLLQSSIHGRKRGGAQPCLYLSEIQLFPFSLPSPPEQHRIVARIDQLMARCDELEKLRKEREEKRLAIHAAAIKQLLDALDGSAWDFIQQHFGELYTVKENVAELRKTILQLAVMGRIVPQDAGDPPASELLKEIEAEKQRLVKEGKIKKPKPLPPIKPEEGPYQLPQGWEWVRLGTILCFGPTNGFSPKAVDYITPVRSLTLSATTSGVFNGEYSKFIANEIPEDSTLWLEDGDILVQRGNTIEYVGVPAVYRGGAKQFIYPDLMMKLRVFSRICVDYTYRAMSAESSRQNLRSNASGTSSTMPKINQATLRNLPFPLPPLPEQHRIVARIDQLMALCDTLDQLIDAATGKQNEILNAVMAQV